MKRGALRWFALGPLFGACSLMDLDDIGLARCQGAAADVLARGEYDDPCRALNEHHGLSLTTDCEVYQCRSDGRGCELRAQDLDRDGVSSQLCDSAGDCDDTRAEVAPGRAESCDALDNDCDGEVDEALRWEPEDEVQRLSVAGRSAPTASTLRDGRLLLLDVLRTGGVEGVVFDGVFRGPPSVLVKTPAAGNCGPLPTSKCDFSSARLQAQGDQWLLAGLDVARIGAAPVLFSRFDAPLMDESEIPAWSAPALDETVSVPDAERLTIPAPAPTLALNVAQRTALAAWTSAQSMRLAWFATGPTFEAQLLDTSALLAPEGEGEATIAATENGFVVAYAVSDRDCDGLALACAGGQGAVERCGCVGDSDAVSPAFDVAQSGAERTTFPLGLAWREGGSVSFVGVTPDSDRSQPGLAGVLRIERDGRAVGAPAVVRLPQGPGSVESRFLLSWTETCASGACAHAAVVGTRGDSSRTLTAPYALPGLDLASEAQSFASVYRDDASAPAAPRVLLVLASPGSAAGAKLACVNDAVSISPAARKN